MKANDAKRLKELEVENAPLKKLIANQALDIYMLKKISSGTSDPDRKRRAAEVLRERFGVSEGRACAVVRIHRSTMRLQPAPITDEEAELRSCCVRSPPTGPSDHRRLEDRLQRQPTPLRPGATVDRVHQPQAA